MATLAGEPTHMPNSKWDEGEISDFRLVMNLLHATFFFFLNGAQNSGNKDTLKQSHGLIILLFAMMILLNVEEI